MAKRHIFGWFRKDVTAAPNRSVRPAMPSTAEKRGSGDCDGGGRPRDSGHGDGAERVNLGDAGHRKEHRDIDGSVLPGFATTRPPHESHAPIGSWHSASSQTHDVNELSEDFLKLQIGSPPPEPQIGPAAEFPHKRGQPYFPVVVHPQIPVLPPPPGVPELILNVRTKRCRCPPGAEKGASKGSRKPQRTYTSRGFEPQGFEPQGSEEHARHASVETLAPLYKLVEKEEKRTGRPQKVKQTLPKKVLLLACPFLKHDPGTYEQRNSCRGKAYHDIHRLKEHLYRVHKQKVHCVRCGEFFPSEADVKQHLIRDEGLCELVKGVSVEGMDAAQEKELKSKKRKRHIKTEEDKWKEIYRILFPASAEIPDPYYKSQADTVAKDGGPASMDQSDVESIFAKDIPPDLEEETFCKVESISGPLGGEERRKMLSIFKGFVTKRLKLLKETTTASDDVPGAATARSCPDKPKSVASSPQAPSQASREQRGGLGVDSCTTSRDPDDAAASAAEPIAILSTERSHCGSGQLPASRVSTQYSQQTPHEKVFYPIPTTPKERGHNPLDLETRDFNGDSDLSCWPMWEDALAGGESHGWMNGASADSSVQVHASGLENGLYEPENNDSHSITYDSSFLGGPYSMAGDFMADASTNWFPPQMPWPGATEELSLEKRAVDEPRGPRE